MTSGIYGIYMHGTTCFTNITKLCILPCLHSQCKYMSFWFLCLVTLILVCVYEKENKMIILADDKRALYQLMIIVHTYTHICMY